MMKLSNMLPKLNPSAKEFVLTSPMPKSEPLPANDSGNFLCNGGRSSGCLLDDASSFAGSSGGRRNGRRNGNHLQYRGNHSVQGSWRNDRCWRAKAECIKRTVHVLDIDQSVTQEKLGAVFGSCGKVLDIRICGDPYAILRSAFVEFANEYGARTALTLGGTIIGFFPIRVIPSKTAILPINPAFLPQSEDEKQRASRTIYCANIDKKVNHTQVNDFFESLCGQVTHSRLMENHSRLTRIAFVEFNQAKSALIALKCSGMFLGAFPIRVNQSKTPVRT